MVFEPFIKLTKLEFINYNSTLNSSIPEPPENLTFTELEAYYKEYQFLKDEEELNSSDEENEEDEEEEDESHNQYYDAKEQLSDEENY